MSEYRKVWLGYGPSVNNYWGITRKGVKYLTTRARLWRKSVSNTMIQEDIYPEKGNIGCVILEYPPDRRQRDVDNPEKPLLDSLMIGNGDEEHGVMIDDSQIKMKITVMFPYNSHKKNKMLFAYKPINYDEIANLLWYIGIEVDDNDFDEATAQERKLEEINERTYQKRKAKREARKTYQNSRNSGNYYKRKAFQRKYYTKKKGTPT
jgi:crossover junction endodeoxyribonuclease RusA